MGHRRRPHTFSGLGEWAETRVPPTATATKRLTGPCGSLASTGSLNILMRVKGIATVDTLLWSISGNQGPDWKQANVPVNPSGAFQVLGILNDFSPKDKAPTH